MKKIIYLGLASLFTFTTACNNTDKKDKINEWDKDEIENQDPAPEMREMEEDRVIQVVLDGKSGSAAQGEIYFTESKGRVKMEGKFSNLGKDHKHAIHLHENGDCNSEDGSSAGGHWNPTNAKHGKWDDSDGYHAGDIGNISSDADGNAGFTFETDQWCIGCGDAERDIVGKSVIVHTDKDDFKSQPTGDAGGRILCGVIK